LTKIGERDRSETENRRSIPPGFGDSTGERIDTELGSGSDSASPWLSALTTRSECGSQGATLWPQSRPTPALPTGLRIHGPRDWGHQRPRVYNPWEHPVTICIGAICRENKEDRIVLCADQRVGIEGFASAETGFKLDVIGPGFAAMIAGTLARGRELCGVFNLHIDELLNNGQKLTQQNILDVLKEPPKMQKRRLLDEYFENTWGITHQQFLDGKLKHFPDSDRSKIAADIQAIHLDCFLLIAGFIQNTAFLCMCEDSGRVLRLDDFATIGSGSTVAQASLYRRGIQRFSLLEPALYAVYEAKKFAEIDPIIGTETNLVVMAPDRSPSWVSNKGRKHLDERMQTFFPDWLPLDKFPADFFDAKSDETVQSSQQ
jgi:20S proteasome alpha/beta subunit